MSKPYCRRCAVTLSKRPLNGFQSEYAYHLEHGACRACMAAARVEKAQKRRHEAEMIAWRQAIRNSNR
jgi:hypothetical protein